MARKSLTGSKRGGGLAEPPLSTPLICDATVWLCQNVEQSAHLYKAIIIVVLLFNA